MLVQSELTDSIGSITLDQPAKRNALSEALIEQILAAFKRFREASARVVVIRADRAASVWSSGHDIAELPQGHDPLAYSDPLERLLRAVRSFPAPVIAMIHGSVWGGATDLVLSCDLVIGDETCAFAVTPVNLGLPYNTTGLLQFMRAPP
jgi:methylmalonyl-CoA decarboxylase